MWHWRLDFKANSHSRSWTSSERGQWIQLGTASSVQFSLGDENWIASRMRSIEWQQYHQLSDARHARFYILAFCVFLYIFATSEASLQLEQRAFDQVSRSDRPRYCVTTPQLSDPKHPKSVTHVSMYWLFWIFLHIVATTEANLQQRTLQNIAKLWISKCF